MAIFASTTTSGYGDPLKALSIKALEQRMKDQQAQQAAQQNDAAMMATIPGGIGHVLGVVGDRMAQSRTETAVAAQKEELAKLIAADPTGENPQTQARMAVIAPDMYKDIVQQIAERRRQQAEHAHATNLQQGTQTFQRGENELNRGETRATRDQQNAQFNATQDLTKSESALTRQNTRDLATQQQRAQADLAQAERDLKVSEAALERAHKTGTVDQQSAAAAALEETRARHGLARDAANNAFQGEQKGLDRTATADLQKNQQVFTGGENAADRAAREKLQVGQHAFQGGESAQERALREKLQGTQIEATAAEGDKGRGSAAAIATAKIESDQKLAQAEAEAKAKLAATDPKRNEAIRDSETAYRKGLSHIDNLEQAATILEHKDGIYTGALQHLAPGASGVPGVSMFVDKEKAQRTSRYNTLVGEDAIRDMAETLKGSSTNFEMQKFEKMKNDPNISDADRATQLRKAIKSARADLEAQARETKAVGGDVSRVDKAMSGEGPADPLEGRTANGPDGPLVRRGGKWVKP